MLIARWPSSSSAAIFLQIDGLADRTRPTAGPGRSGAAGAAGVRRRQRPAARAAGARRAPAPSGAAGGRRDRRGQERHVRRVDLDAPGEQAVHDRLRQRGRRHAHNVELKTGRARASSRATTFNGVATKVYDVPALPAGAYTFLCTVHPTMTGTATLK